MKGPKKSKFLARMLDNHARNSKKRAARRAIRRQQTGQNHICCACQVCTGLPTISDAVLLVRAYGLVPFRVKISEDAEKWSFLFSTETLTYQQNCELASKLYACCRNR